MLHALQNDGVTVMNKTVTEIKNTLEGINTRITQAKEWISDLKDRMVESLP